MKTIDIINTLPYFTLAQISLLYKNKKEASVIISNKLRQKKIHSIREGIYLSDDKLKEIMLTWKISSFLAFSATHLIYTPSYLSLEYVLFENNIITENVYTFTLVSTKKTATFKNEFWTFHYKSIKEEFFWDYYVYMKDGFCFYKATPEKALFDYFYFKKDFVFDEEYLNELRINRENVDIKRLEKVVKKYKSKKMQKIFTFIKNTLWL